jgi:hypothetical protein
MDRRDALKKLGVGGAVAVAVPVLLDSFNVANASSTALPAGPQVNAAIIQPSPGTSTFLDLTFSNSPQLFPSSTTFVWSDLPVAPAVTFAPFNALVTRMTVGQGNMNSETFSVNLAATFNGTTQNYTFTWAKKGPMSAA